MITTGTDICTRALRLLQVVGATQTPDAPDAQIAFETLNEFIDSLRTQQAAAPSLQRIAYPLTALQQQYTIGVGGNFNQTWPEIISGVSVIPNRAAGAQNIQEIPLGRPLTWAEFQGVVQKGTQSAWPTAIFYDRAWTLGLGRIWVFPIPTISTADLVLYTPNTLGTFATPATQYDVKPGYALMLRYNLAVLLADDFEKTASARVVKVAEKTLADIKRANQEFNLGQVDPAMPGVGRGAQFNPWTGTYNN